MGEGSDDNGWAPWSDDPNPTPEGWARAALALARDEVGLVPMVDGKRATVREYEAVRKEWYDAVVEANGLDSLRDHNDTAASQRAATWAYRVARDNPHTLPAWMLAEWQRHAATVARGARADYVRDRGGTGVELWLIEDACCAVGDALAVRQRLEALGNGNSVFDDLRTVAKLVLASGCTVDQACSLMEAVYVSEDI